MEEYKRILRARILRKFGPSWADLVISLSLLAFLVYFLASV